MNYRYFDVHAHVHGTYGEGVDITEYSDAGVGCITVGTDLESSQEAVALANAHEHVWATIGVHPVDDSKAEFDVRAFEVLLTESNKIVAVGECGIDYYYSGLDTSDAERKRQRDLFASQIEFAAKHDLPLMLHGRPSKGSTDAYDDMVEILQAARVVHGEVVRGNVHFFVGDVRIADAFMELGFTFSFSGVITFAKEYEEVVWHIPLASIHGETDSPYAAPKPYRGKQNSPLYVEHMYAKIAEIKQLPLEEVRQQLLINARRVFKVM